MGYTLEISHIKPNCLKQKVEKVANHTYLLKKGEIKETNLAQDVYVLSLVKDGEYYIKSFIDHYSDLGIKHIFLIDNGSLDKTNNIASQYTNVTIFQCSLPFGEYKLAMRRFLIEMYGRNKWCLSVDIDEYWEYPYQNKITIECFINYLDSFGYTGCLSHQLDLFEKAASLNNNERESTINNLDHYDLSDVFMWWENGNNNECIDPRLKDFLNGNVISSNKIPIMAGGIRMHLFGIIPILTKISLFKFDSSVMPFLKSSHKIEGAFIADISCVLLHKLLHNQLKEKSVNCIKSGGYYNNSYNYKMIYSKLCNKPIATPNQANLYKSVNNLIENNFIHISKNYLVYIKNNKSK